MGKGTNSTYWHSAPGSADDVRPGRIEIPIAQTAGVGGVEKDLECVIEARLAVCKQLNPSAKVVEASYSRIDVKEIVQTGMFSFDKAATGAGWLRSLHELS